MRTPLYFIALAISGQFVGGGVPLCEGTGGFLVLFFVLFVLMDVSEFLSKNR